MKLPLVMVMCCVSIAAMTFPGFWGCTPSAVNPPPDGSDASPARIDGGTLHSYTCALEGGIAWTCQDGLTTPLGTCPMYCVPTTTVTVTRP